MPGGRNKYRNESPILHDGFQPFQDFLLAEFPVFEVFFHQGVVALGGGFHQGGAGFLGGRLELCRDVFGGLAVAFVGFHCYQVDDAVKIEFLAERQL